MAEKIIGKKLKPETAKPKAKTGTKNEEGPKPAGSAPPESGGRRICIICQQEKNGRAVRNDVFINAVRAVKKTLGMATNNRLVVCEACLPEHKKRRSAFEKTLLQYGVFGAVLGLILLVISRNLPGLGLALLMLAFMLGLAAIHYHPASEAN